MHQSQRGQRRGVKWGAPLAESASDATDDDDDAWGNVPGFKSQQVRGLRRLYEKGVLWKRPVEGSKSCSSFVVFRLKHGGEVSSDGNCLFTSMEKALGSVVNGKELRTRAVRRFLEGYESVNAEERNKIDDSVRNMYSPDLKYGWGIHVVQEIKLLGKKGDREALDSTIDELVQFGMQRLVRCWRRPFRAFNCSCRWCLANGKGGLCNINIVNPAHISEAQPKRKSKSAASCLRFVTQLA